MTAERGTLIGSENKMFGEEVEWESERRKEREIRNQLISHSGWHFAFNWNWFSLDIPITWTLSREWAFYIYCYYLYVFSGMSLRNLQTLH